jgi:hypothetical protein
MSRCEASALAAIGAVNRAEINYAARLPDRGFAPNLAMLERSDEHDEFGIKEANLSSGSFAGYVYTYNPAVSKDGIIRSYSITAFPKNLESSCRHSFYSDQSGRVHYTSSGHVDASSPALQ